MLIRATLRLLVCCRRAIARYVDASIQLYLDVLNLFLYILRMLGKKK
jgi:FtsH-binding integral membrane protein